MSIASEVSALQSDKTAIASALAAKGVSGASAHGFDDFAADIAGIPAGDHIGTASKTLSSNATSISFNSLLGTPKWFAVICRQSSLSSSSTTRRILDVVWDGTTHYGHCYHSSVAHSTSNYSHTYSGGTLTVSSAGSSSGGSFHNGSSGYTLIYGYQEA